MKLVLYFIFTVTFVFFASNSKASSIEIWTKNHLVSEDSLLCQKSIEGDYFFVAINNYKIKTGYRIDVTNKNSMPKTFIMSFEFTDENNNHVGLPLPPEIVESNYVSINKNIYAEEVAYRELSLSKTNILFIKISLMKYDDFSKAPQIADLIDDQLQNVMECTVSLN